MTTRQSLKRRRRVAAAAAAVLAARSCRWTQSRQRCTCLPAACLPARLDCLPQRVVTLQPGCQPGSAWLLLSAPQVVRRIQFTALWFVSQLSEGLLPEVELVSRQASNRTLEAAGGGDADDDGGGDGEDGGGGPFVLRLQAATQRRSLLGRHPESAEAVARLWVLLEAVQGLVLAGETETQRGLWYRFKTLEVGAACWAGAGRSGGGGRGGGGS